MNDSLKIHFYEILMQMIEYDVKSYKDKGTTHLTLNQWSRCNCFCHEFMDNLLDDACIWISEMPEFIAWNDINFETIEFK